MSRLEAEAWSARSSESRPLFHSTSSDAAAAIRRGGFDLSRRQFGRTWGNGVYATPEIDVATLYAGLYGADAAIIELRANLRRVLKVRLEASTRAEMIRRVLLTMPDAYPRYVQWTVRLGSRVPPALVPSEELTQVLTESGYDALIGV